MRRITTLLSLCLIASVLYGEEKAEVATVSNSDDRFLILIPKSIEDTEGRAEYDFMDASDRMEDSIAMGALAYSSNNEVGLLRRLKLGEKWLCITFPNKPNRNALRTDILTTTGYIENLPHGYQLTTLSIAPEANRRNKRIPTEGHSTELVLNYDIAFIRGDNSSSDFKYYKKKEVSKENSLRITDIIRKELNVEYRTKPYGLQTDSLYLIQMAQLKEDLYYAEYKPRYSDNDTDAKGNSIFLVKGNQILLWDARDSHLELEVFRLKDKDYIWEKESDSSQSFTDLYILSDDELSMVYGSRFYFENSLNKE